MLRSIAIVALLTVALSACFNVSTTRNNETYTNTHDTAAKVETFVPADTISVVLTGDVMLGLNYPDTLMPIDSGRQLFSEVAHWLTNADVTVGNLEGIISNLGEPKKQCLDTAHCYFFRMPEELTPRLAEAGYDALSIANNHSRDFGDSAILQTLQRLEENEIACAGQRRFCKEAIFERNGHSFGYIAFSPHAGSMSLLDISSAKESVKALKQQCDIVIVSMHAGAEGADYVHTPDTAEYYFEEARGCVKCFAHAVIDAGADIVYGHGPHVPRAIEVYNHRLIAYSLGNFCTPYRVSTKGYAGYAPIIRATINKSGELVKATVLSAIQYVHTGPRVDAQQRAARLIKQLTEEDFPDMEVDVDSTDVLTYRIKQ